MKSPLVTNLDAVQNKDHYSDLKVLRSNAGFYIGTTVDVCDDAGNVLYEDRGSRDSGYFRTEDEAAQHLKLLTALGPEISASVLRQHP